MRKAWELGLDTYSDLRVISVTMKDLTYIKSLLVGWDVTELGALEFLTPERERLYEIFEDDYQKENLYYNGIFYGLIFLYITLIFKWLLKKNIGLFYYSVWYYLLFLSIKQHLIQKILPSSISI